MRSGERRRPGAQFSLLAAAPQFLDVRTLLPAEQLETLAELSVTYGERNVSLPRSGPEVTMTQLSPQRRRVIAPALLGLVLLAFWAAPAAAAASPVLLPGPARVLARLWTDLTTGSLWPYLGVTLGE